MIRLEEDFAGQLWKKVDLLANIRGMSLWKRLEPNLHRPVIMDGIIGLAFIAIALLNLRVTWDYVQPDINPALAIGLTLAVLLPLTWRRRFPLLVLVIVVNMLLIYRHLDIPEGTITAYGAMLALFTAGAYGNKRWRTPVRGICVAAIALNLFYFVFFAEGDWAFPEVTIWPRMLVILFNLFLFGAAWWAGDIMRTSRQREDALKERTRQLAAERDENQRRFVLEERVRISRELHDVVAHHVSVIGIQAGAARRIIDKDTEKATEALSVIESSSRHAVNEMQHILGLLRQEHPVDNLDPQPSIERLDELVGSIRKSGLQVEVKVSGKVQPLPLSIDLSAYRIIQEALTNTLKHAGPARTTVNITYHTDSLELNILDDGQGSRAIHSRGNRGNGLIGMRERVKLHGGEFQAGPCPEAGYQVLARLPFMDRNYEN